MEGCGYVYAQNVVILRLYHQGKIHTCGETKHYDEPTHSLPFGKLGVWERLVSARKVFQSLDQCCAIQTEAYQ